MESLESGITKTGVLRKYTWQLRFDWVARKGELTIKNARAKGARGCEQGVSER
jgi:hypothetical protein